MKLALIASGAAIAVFAGATALGPHSAIDDSLPTIGASVVKQADLRQAMRKLWTDHVVWTRSYIVAAVAMEQDVPEAVKRLMKNQEEIGAAVGEFYGTAAGDKLTALLKAHISQAAEVLRAAKAGDKTGLAAKDKIWRQNAEEIATFFANANPNLKRNALSEMMQAHLTSTTDEVVARLNKDWAADVKAYDHGYAHILKMADALAEGIAKQFPAKVTADF